MATNWIKMDTREYKTGQFSIVETTRTPMTDNIASGPPTVSVAAEVKPGNYANITVVKNGLQQAIDALTLWGA